MKLAEIRKKIRLLIVDDQNLFATSLKLVLESGSDGEFTVSGIARNGIECLELLRSISVDVILMDVRMPEMDGVKATELVHEQYPETKIMMLTTFDDDEYVKHAMKAGATGYVMKTIDADELVSCVRAVNMGAHLMSPSIGNKLFKSIEGQGKADVFENELEQKIDYLRTRFPDLKRREAEVLMQIVNGRNNDQIADTLRISKNTVNNYTSTIYGKLGVDDRFHAVQLVENT